MNLRLGSPFAKETSRFSVPIVVIDRPLDGSNLSAVSMDNVAGARAALTHLYGHGYRDIVVLSGDASTYDSQQRLIGCRQAARHAGVTWDPRLVWPGAFTEQSGGDIVRKWLCGGRGSSRAIFCFNDHLAIGVMNALRQHGLRVPHDVAVVGFDDLESARLVDLTTVRVPVHAVGRAAAEAAIDAIQGRPVERYTILPTELIVRGSCGCTSAERVMPSDLEASVAERV
jgi:DNA-binding LacI/PurR family transcriptional regulator